MKNSDKQKSNKQNFTDIMRVVKYLLDSMWKIKLGKKYIIVKTLLSILDSLFPIVYIIMPGLIINELTNLHRLEVLILCVAILAVTPFINHIKDMTLRVYHGKIRREVIRLFEEKLYNHVADMDFETLENPDIQVSRNRIGMYGPGSAADMTDLVFRLLEAVLSTIAVSSILITINPFVVAFLMAIIFINSVVTKKINHKDYLIDKEVSIKLNHYWIHFYPLNDSRYAKETRLFGTKDYFINMFTNIGRDIDALRLKNVKYSSKMRTIHALTNLIQQLTLYAYLIYNVLYRSLAVGTMTIFLSAVGQFSSYLSNIFNVYLEIGRYSLNAQELIDFMSLPMIQNTSGDLIPTFSDDSVIEFKNVSFKYPGSENYALKNLNIKIFGNQKLCVVGANGSGKTTFIKLLTRLYSPSEGEILLNNIDIKNYNYKMYQRLFSPVFQDFSIYSLPLVNNITLSETYNTQKMESAIEKSGLKSLISGLPKGYNTYVQKDIDIEGFEPSGGEGQKIAIARALYHDASIYLLDEPTAALDPIAEYEIYERFSGMISDKAAVLVTHRLSAVQLADKIAVFSDGVVAEYGTHKELYSKGGIYTEMFDKQAQFYRDDKKENE